MPEIDMFVGESRVFPAPNVGRIAVGNGQIMTAAALDNKEVIVFANGAGTSSLFVWNEDGRYQRIKINIVAGDTSRISREIAAFLSAIPHAKASVVGDKVIVEGDNLSDADLTKIEQLEKRYPQLVNFTNKIGWEQMVMMDVKVVEFPKSELRDIGLKWGGVGGATIGGIWSPIRRGTDGPYTVNIPASQNGLPVTSGSTDSTQRVVLPSALNILSGINLGINAQLNLLEQNGQASILAEPQLSARNGAEASFLAGGEFPYSVSNINGTTIIFKPYGVRLNITPKVDHNGVIRAKIDAEVSSIDASISTTGGPALLTRKTITEFNVRSGQTMVLSGLLQRNSSTDIDKVPLLGDIPILGALFRSKRFQNKETELVVFVTPTVVNAQSPGLVDRVEKTTERLEKRLGRTPYLSDPLQPGSSIGDVNKVLQPAAAARAPASTPLATSAQSASLSPLQMAPTANLQAAKIAEATTSPAAPASPAPQVDLKSIDREKPPVNIGTNPAPISSASNTAMLLQVSVDHTILRSKPDVKSGALLELARGAIVRIDDSAAAPQRPAWRAVIVGATAGWILRNAAAPVDAQQLMQTTKHADQANRQVPAQRIHVGQRSNNVQPGTRAAVAVRPAENPATDEPEICTLPRFRVLLDGLAMRVPPNINATAVMQLDRGAELEGLPESPQGVWTAVQIGERRGWVPAQWLLPLDSSKPGELKAPSKASDASL